jgi:hypothetical protein
MSRIKIPMDLRSWNPSFRNTRERWGTRRSGIASVYRNNVRCCHGSRRHLIDGVGWRALVVESCVRGAIWRRQPRCTTCRTLATLYICRTVIVARWSPSLRAAHLSNRHTHISSLRESRSRSGIASVYRNNVRCCHGSRRHLIDGVGWRALVVESCVRGAIGRRPRVG